MQQGKCQPHPINPLKNLSTPDKEKGRELVLSPLSFTGSHTFWVDKTDVLQQEKLFVTWKSVLFCRGRSRHYCGFHHQMPQTHFASHDDTLTLDMMSLASRKNRRCIRHSSTQKIWRWEWLWFNRLRETADIPTRNLKSHLLDHFPSKHWNLPHPRLSSFRSRPEKFLW